MSERIAVIGSNSFSGASFVAFALQAGADVVGFSRSEEPSQAFLPYRWLDPDSQTRFRFIRADLNRDLELLASAIIDLRPSIVVNFAAQSMVAESWTNPEHWYQTNVVANVLLHERLRKMECLRRYVHVTTPEVYGTCSGTIDESAPFNPSTPYAASRAACDLHLRTFFRQYAFPVVFTRAANVYGPGQQLYRIIPRTILSILLGRTLQLHGGGHSVRSFIHIDDVADGTMRVARNGEPGATYHLSTARFVSIRELVQMICDRMGVSFSSVATVADERPGKDSAYLLDSRKIQAELGWAARRSLENGIDETIAWMKRHLTDLRQQPFDYLHQP